jgi:GMP synthase-like glutamine amidotransferase
MKPVAIFRHAATEGPGYLAEFLDAHHIPWRLIAVDRGEAVPHEIADFSGLVFMGGPMSVNDDLPWIKDELDLIRDAVAKDIPVLGHCLGGQLISKALGAVVSKNAVKEIGWGRVQVDDNEVARSWFGDIRTFDAFHWHGETFVLPDSAVHLLSNEHCVNQGYALGKHLALQCHVEMTKEMIASWCEVGTDEIASALGSPAVQKPDEIVRLTADKLPQLGDAASVLYDHWISGLNRA